MRSHSFAGGVAVFDISTALERVWKWRKCAFCLALCAAVLGPLAGTGRGAELDGVSLLGGVVQGNIYNDSTVLNANAADTTNADQLRSGGGLGLTLTGAGVTVGIWDGGSVRSTHQEFTGNVTVVDAVANSNHSTHVAGTIAAQGISATARGMASGVQIRSRDFNNDTTEMAADAGLIDLSNHSYGFGRGWIVGQTFPTSFGNLQAWFGNYSVSAVEDSAFGNYDSNSSTIDGIIHANPHLLSVWAASNDRNDTFSGGVNTMYIAFFSTPPVSFHENLGGGFYVVSSATGHTPPPKDGNGATGYDTLPNGGQTAKNVLVVGSMADHLTDPHNGAAMTLSAFSSIGPTDDGRLAPHVVGNGESLTSPIATNNTSYSVSSGTSMATPNVTGTAALLHEHWTDVSGSDPEAAALKALLIHTATDVTGGVAKIGPDYATGYGMVNGAAAANFATDAFLTPLSARTHHVVLEALADGAETVISNLVAVGGAIKATLVWTDPAGTPQTGLDNLTSVLVNDLDLWITDSSNNIYYPWTLDVANPSLAAVRTQFNHLDNVEQVLIDMALAGDFFSIHVSHTGGLQGGLPQDFALLFEGVQQVPEPATWGLAVVGIALLLIGSVRAASIRGFGP